MLSLSSETKTRTISALILGAAVLFITWYNATSFTAMCLLGGFILGREWWSLTKHRSWLFVPLGVLYIGAGIASLIFIRTLMAEPNEQASYLVFMLFGLVWSADIGGYIVGKRFGKHKIWPRVSPGKSWEGLLGSILFSTLYWLGVVQLLGSGINATVALFSLVVCSVFSVVGLLGDLFESALKRNAGVKDSGKLIPGHGGLFDRVDALLPCAMLFALILLVMKLALMAQGLHLA